MMSSSDTPAKQPAPKRPMVADLVGYATADAVEVTSTVLDEAGTCPGPVDAAATALARVADWAAANRVDQISDLTGARAEQLLRDLTGATSLEPTDAATADALHLYRNTITLLRAMVLVSRPSIVTRRSDRPAKDTIDAGLPEIGPRTAYRVRPLRADEIILARSLVTLDLNENAPHLPVHNYVLSEAGHAPMEITHATINDLTWEDQTPVSIQAHGLHKRGARTLSFDAWQRHVLSITVPAYRASGRTYLAYNGTSPGTKEACASTSPALVRFLRRAGITGRDVSTGSVALWRGDHVLQTQRDLAAAAHTLGTTSALLVRNLHYAIEEINIHRGIATLITLDTRPDVHVPAEQVQGLVSWIDDKDKPGVLRPAA